MALPDKQGTNRHRHTATSVYRPPGREVSRPGPMGNVIALVLVVHPPTISSGGQMSEAPEPPQSSGPRTAMPQIGTSTRIAPRSSKRSVSAGIDPSALGFRSFVSITCRPPGSRATVSPGSMVIAGRQYGTDALGVRPRAVDLSRFPAGGLDGSRPGSGHFRGHKSAHFASPKGLRGWPLTKNVGVCWMPTVST